MTTTPVLNHHALKDRLGQIDWTDVDAVAASAVPLLADLVADPSWLTQTLERLPADPHLFPMCEQLAELDKLVLFDDPVSGSRIRLHVFRQGYFDRPHNHRFTFASRILSGGYRHTVYGDLANPSTDLDVTAIHPLLVKQERAGESYVINHSLLHSVAAAVDTTTLTVRGPAVKDRLLIIDKAAGHAWWAYGAAFESEAERLQRQLPAERIREIHALLSAQGILARSAVR